jgi:hypothetical protein
VQPVDHQHPHQPLGVPAFSLDPVLRGTFDLPRTRRRPRTPPPSRHARPSRPRCEPWPRSVSPLRLWAPRGVPPARLHITPRVRRGGTDQYLQLRPDDNLHMV